MNAYEAYLMNTAVVNMKEKNKYDSQFFLFVFISNWIQWGLVCPISKDLDALEISGIIMHDITAGENIFAFALVLFIVGDNTHHTELCLSKVSRTVCSYRRCVWQADSQSPSFNNFTSFQITINDFFAT